MSGGSAGGGGPSSSESAGPGPADGAGFVDIHNHVIPGVDDGAQDAEESVSALTVMHGEGVRVAVATPHIELSLAVRGVLSERLAEIDAGWSRLERVADGTGVAIERGAEVRLDVADPDLSDTRLRLGGGRFVLVEFPFFTVPPRSARVLALIVARGWLPVVAHPERYAGLDPGLEIADEWAAAGAFLQLNGGSLLGRYGEEAERLAWALLARGRVAIVASDYHARGDPRIGEYRDRLVERGGVALMRQLLASNPARILRDEPPLPVAPLEAESPTG